MPPKVFKNRQEVDQYYDKMALELADKNKGFENFEKEMIRIFLTDTTYVDQNGETKTSPGVNEQEIGSSKYQDAYDKLYGSGRKSLRETNRAESAPAFMRWYCLTHGISAEEMNLLGKNPDAPEAENVRTKLKNIRQDYQKLITSNDPEKLSDFLISVFDEYAKQKDTLAKCGTVDGLVKNWPSIAVFSGVTGLQQSLEDPYNKRTEEQEALIAKLNEKIAKKYGPELKINNIIGQLSLPMTAMQFCYKFDLTSVENAKEAEQRALQTGRVDDAKLRRLDMAKVVRGFKAYSVISQKEERQSENRFYTINRGKAASFNVAEFFGFEGALGGIATPNSEIHTNELKALAGDPTGVQICDFDAIPTSRYGYMTQDNQYELRNGKVISYVSSALDINDVQKIFSLDECQTQYDKLFEEATIERNGETIETNAFMADIEAKINAGEPIKPVDIVVYKTSSNGAYTDEMRQLSQKVFEHNILFRPSEFKDPVFKAMITAEVKNLAGCSLEAYALGIADMKEARSVAYESTVKDYLAGKVTTGVNKDFHDKCIEKFDTIFSKVGVTIASSKEFKALDSAYKVLKNPDLLKPGKEFEYVLALSEVARTAKEYRQAKQADGKIERRTDKGQVRYNLAEMLQGFAVEAAKGIQTVKNAVMEARAKEAQLIEKEPEKKVEEKLIEKESDSKSIIKNRNSQPEPVKEKDIIISI